ncbi:ead/Ea22-like family protein [Citrobacter freundii]|uniref:ead/Ea22-like family protein n=1 Tax=Citrobacter freundii TaxID=546 RepID=UPI0028BF1C04|nr:ead/Ea22-like family protein [Citrobacter freundii]MDT7436496.1 ead/Ea22-like family protein [Citrobacter freundii]
MSNIDKRALRKAAMHAKTEDDWGCDADNFHDKATPDAVLSLLDELEASQKSNEFLKEQLAQLANFNPDWDKLEAATDSLREHMAKLSAAEKRITDYHTVLNNLAAVARRYLPDYDEHPDIQAADDLLESAAGIGVNGE